MSAVGPCTLAHSLRRTRKGNSPLNTSHDPTPKIRNSVTVESPYGLRSFTLQLGDIARSKDSVLVVPTHANPQLWLTGGVLYAVAKRYAVDFNTLEPLIVPHEGFGTYRVRDRGSFPGQEILVVRIPGHDIREELIPASPNAYHRALWTLFGSLAALELRTDEHKSLALPLLGATRGYKIVDLMRAILEHSLPWLKVSRFMHAINFYLFDEHSIDDWTFAMDDVLGRKFVDSAENQLIKALREEILAHLTTNWSGSLSLT